MKKSKTQKGITLIALIITIVVLLILAVVAISSIQNDGILSYAQNAAKDYNQAQVNEQDILEGYLSHMPGNDSSSSVTWIQNGMTVNNGTDTLEVGDIVKVKIGDTEAVNYTAGDYSGNWAILGAENGKLLLVSETNVKSSIELTVADYLDEGARLNSICKVYLNETYADDARSINVEDINRVTGFIPGQSEDNAGVYGTIYNLDVVENANYTFPDGTKVGNLDSTSERLTITDTYYYYNPMADGVDYWDDTISSLEEKATMLLMGNGFSLDYALASTYGGINCGLRVMNGTKPYVYKVELWDIESGSSYTDSSYGVRAVVSLKSNVEVVKTDA